MRPDLRSTRTVGLAVLICAPYLTYCGSDSALDAARWTGPPFSAQIVGFPDSTKPPTRIYMGVGRIRLEVGKPDDRSAIVFDPAHRTTLLISMKDRTYVDAGMFTSLVARGAAPVMRFLRPTDATNPCADWNAMVEHFRVGRDNLSAHSGQSDPTRHVLCQHLGAEAVGGRPAQKWAVAAADRSDSGTLWIDDRLHIVSRSSGSSGGIQLRDIQEGPQPAGLFEPPAGYRRLGLTEMLAKLKHATAPS